MAKYSYRIIVSMLSGEGVWCFWKDSGRTCESSFDVMTSRTSAHMCAINSQTSRPGCLFFSFSSENRISVVKIEKNLYPIIALA